MGLVWLFNVIWDFLMNNDVFCNFKNNEGKVQNKENYRIHMFSWDKIKFILFLILPLLPSSYFFKDFLKKDG